MNWRSSLELLAVIILIVTISFSGCVKPDDDDNYVPILTDDSQATEAGIMETVEGKVFRRGPKVNSLERLRLP